MPWTPAHPTESVRGATKTTTTIIIVIISISRSYFCVVRTTHISFALAVKAISSFFFSSCRARFSSLSTFTRAWAPLTEFWRKNGLRTPRGNWLLQGLVQCKSSRSKAFSAGLWTLEKKPGLLLLTGPFRVQTRFPSPLLLVHSLSLQGTGRRGAWEQGCFVGGLPLYTTKPIQTYNEHITNFVSLVTQVTEPRIFSCDLCPASNGKTLGGDY